jgi:hypothetical protein
MQVAVALVDLQRVGVTAADLSPRSFARLPLTRPNHLSDKQRRLRDELVGACGEMIDLADLVGSFADLLRPRAGNEKRSDDWTTTARAADFPRLHAFTGGLDQDRPAVTPCPTTTAAPKVSIPKRNRSCDRCTAAPASTCYAIDFSSDNPPQRTVTTAIEPEPFV